MVGTLPQQERMPLMERVEELAVAHPILGNRYFTALRDDAMELELFRRTQKQFFFAVRFFSRPMAALMARMPDSALRQGLIHNLSEEHGFDDEDPSKPPGFDPAVAHDLTFRAFLQTLGVNGSEMAREPEGPEVRAFNLGLIGACMMERVEFAFACLGVIEYVFADICELIGGKVVERGWVEADELVHYKLHAMIDKEHAADFFRVVDTTWSQGGDAAAAVDDGIAFGLHLFDRLYEDLLSARG
ncbi:MAG: iron-containing redox enzyme family protein [Luteolibacter sp.]